MASVGSGAAVRTAPSPDKCVLSRCQAPSCARLFPSSLSEAQEIRASPAFTIVSVPSPPFEENANPCFGSKPAASGESPMAARPTLYLTRNRLRPSSPVTHREQAMLVAVNRHAGRRFAPVSGHAATTLWLAASSLTISFLSSILSNTIPAVGLRETRACRASRSWRRSRWKKYPVRKHSCCAR